ncbi:MAG: Smr/MutS family protein, partial [Candidatus Bathyarchaeia archaeon]
EGVVRDEFVTQRNGRFVIPVSHDYRGRVPGVVHGVSSSGATAFVEPIVAIEENNELVRLRELEAIEVAKVLFSLSEEVRKELPAVCELVAALAHLDTIVAKANFAKDYNCIKPQMNTGGRLELLDARHPILEYPLRQSQGQVVPISFQLYANSSAMVISGPNAGGKTVVLKTAGLLAMLAQSGLHVPAKDAAFPVFASILADIGDHQSIAANLSTFSSHISNIREMVGQIALPALVLLDEVGTGTDPEEGAALGVAIVDYFKSRGACVIVSTHYSPLKYYATQTPDVVNASVEFDEKTLRPTYRLILNVAGTSSGIEIARRLGLQEEILELATKTLDRRDMYQANFLKFIQTEAERLRQLTAALEEERQVTAQKYERIEHEFAVRDQKRQHEFETELAAVIKRFEKMSSELISELKDSAAASRLSKERDRQLSRLKHEVRRALAKPQVQAGKTRQVLRDFSVGDLVTTELGQQGRIEEISDGDIFVRVGSMRFKARASQLTPVGKETPEKPPRRLPEGVSLQRREAVSQISSELNLIGSRVDEALARVDEFLDAAFLEGFGRIRIIHGAGTGRLKRAIIDFLKSHPHVATFQQATPSEGGSGATIVELRQ